MKSFIPTWRYTEGDNSYPLPPATIENVISVSGNLNYSIKYDYNATIYTFTSGTGTVTPNNNFNVEYLIVGGGGGGGKNGGSFANQGLGGGGGAGGVLNDTYQLSKNSTYTLQVGSGGAVASQGSNSKFTDDFIAYGGGAGGDHRFNGGTGGNGGSGGGGAFGVSGDVSVISGGSPIITGITGQGNYGGASRSNYQGAAGGGGAGQKGFDNYDNHGYGGDGILSSIAGGNPVYYGGGGGGSIIKVMSVSNGGKGGGGSGFKKNTADIFVLPSNGTDGLGGGGGGGGGDSNGDVFGRGGNGIVIIRFSTYQTILFTRAFTGRQFTIILDSVSPQDTTYQLSGNATVTNVGAALLTITGTGNFTGSFQSPSITVTPAQITATWEYSNGIGDDWLPLTQNITREFNNRDYSITIRLVQAFALDGNTKIIANQTSDYIGSPVMHMTGLGILQTSIQGIGNFIGVVFSPSITVIKIKTLLSWPSSVSLTTIGPNYGLEWNPSTNSIHYTMEKGSVVNGISNIPFPVSNRQDKFIVNYDTTAITGGASQVEGNTGDTFTLRNFVSNDKIVTKVTIVQPSTDVYDVGTIELIIITAIFIRNIPP
jgi:hypothetical protein